MARDNDAYGKPTWADPICESLATTGRAYSHNSLRIEGTAVVTYGYDREMRSIRFIGETVAEAEAFVAGAKDATNVILKWVQRSQERANAR